VIKNFKDLLK